MLGGQGRLDCSKKEENTPEEKYMFVTFILNKMKLSTEHRKTKKKDKEKRLKEKTPRNMGPKHYSIHTRSEGPTVQLCGESNVARQRDNREDSKRPCTHGGKGESPTQSRILTAL